MAMDQRTRRVFVAIPEADSIEVLDITSADIVDKVKLNLGDRPREVALTADGKTLLAVNGGSNTISFIDTVTLMESGRITVGNGLNSLLKRDHFIVAAHHSYCPKFQPLGKVHGTDG